MEPQIGQKLKDARSRIGLTQEAVAEALGVSRQTVSNWENERSYPDIISVIKLSDLYSVSLDELLKGDQKMMEHLEESTNVVRSKAKLTRTVRWGAYFVIWAVCVLFFWIGADAGDAFGYSLIIFYGVLPLAAFIVSFLDGWENERSRNPGPAPLVCGALHMAAQYLTFSLANMLATPQKLNLPSISAFLTGTAISLAGIYLATLTKRKTQQRSG